MHTGLSNTVARCISTTMVTQREICLPWVTSMLITNTSNRLATAPTGCLATTRTQSVYLATCPPMRSLPTRLGKPSMHINEMHTILRLHLYAWKLYASSF